MSEEKNVNRLSHSAVDRYQRCPKEYEYHYIKKYRLPITTGALLFGSAIDAALNVLLKGEDDYIEKFLWHWQNARINNVTVDIRLGEGIEYSASDYDKDLVTDEDWLYVEAVPEEKQEKYATWMSLKRKGILMLEAYKKDIMPMFEEVLAIQRYIKIENGTDSVIGYVDLVAKMKDGRVVIFDNKTSARAYEYDSVLTSPQLTLYVRALEDEFKTRIAGYIVMKKGILKNKTKKCGTCGFDGTGLKHKTCPEKVDSKAKSRCGGKWDVSIDPQAEIQVLIDNIPLHAENIVLQNYDDINEAIHSRKFNRNFTSCQRPWGRCAFYNLCWKQDKTGLVIPEEN